MNKDQIKYKNAVLANLQKNDIISKYLESKIKRYANQGT